MKNQDSASRHPSSYVDPHGSVFVQDGRFFRAINKSSGPFVASLLNRESVRRLLGTKIVETKVSDKSFPGADLVLEHRTIPTEAYCYEWAPPMIKDAALLHLDIAEALVADGLALQDAYPWNVVFDGPAPVFVDFTSIIPEEKDLFWIAYSQFASFFLYPLYLTACDYGDVVRALLHDYISGITDEQFVRLVPRSFVLRHPSLFIKIILPYLMNRKGKAGGKESPLAALAARFTPTREMRKQFFRSLKNIVEGIDVEQRTTAWATYHDDMDRFTDPSRYSAKETALAGIVGRLRPESVVDIGCNRGGYSLIAERSGARVVAFDTDESAVSHLYRYAQKHQLRILPAMVDITNPSPAGGHGAAQFTPSHERFCSDMGFALAISHHLALTQRQSFERIAAAFSDYARRYLLTEFMPPDDDKVRQITRTTRRDLSWYTLDNFIAALKKHYGSIETMPSHPQGRTLILCSR
jgi:SAM-dependent methyltransferase